MVKKLIRLIVVAGVAFLVFKFWLLPVRTSGASMEPTYHHHDITLVNRLAYWKDEPSRGDVVAIRLSGLKVMYLKRVIGLPDEQIEMRDGAVYINGTLLAEPYLAESDRRSWQVPPVRLAPDEYYVIGDNRQVESSEHLFGRVAGVRIVGRALW